MPHRIEGLPRIEGADARALALADRVAAGGGRLAGERAAALARALRRHGLAVVSRLDADAIAAQCGVTRGQARRLGHDREIGIAQRIALCADAAHDLAQEVAARAVAVLLRFVGEELTEISECQ